MDEKAGSNVVEVGVDLSEFYMSVEWDILEVPAVRYDKSLTNPNINIQGQPLSMLYTDTDRITSNIIKLINSLSSCLM